MAELSSASFAALADSANSLAKVGKDVKKGAVLKFTAHLDAVLPVTAAEDSEQDHYDNISEAWERFLPGLEDVSQEWYKDVSEYYEVCILLLCSGGYRAHVWLPLCAER